MEIFIVNKKYVSPLKHIYTYAGKKYDNTGMLRHSFYLKNHENVVWILPNNDSLNEWKSLESLAHHPHTEIFK